MCVNIDILQFIVSYVYKGIIKRILTLRERNVIRFLNQFWQCIDQSYKIAWIEVLSKTTYNMTEPCNST